MSESCRLYHGPGARQTALDEGYRRGRLLHEPFGDAGLKVAEAREFVALMQAAPVGDVEGVVIAGPLDHAAPKSTDVLLKTIEEPPAYVTPILWATDLGGVASTIRSRCLPVWCPTAPPEAETEDLDAAAQDLVRATLEGQFWQVPGIVAKVKSTPKQRGREPELVAEAIAVMASRASDPQIRALWERVRERATWRNVTPIEVIAAFLGH